MIEIKSNKTDYEFSYLSNIQLMLMLKDLIMPDDKEFRDAIIGELMKREHAKKEG